MTPYPVDHRELGWVPDRTMPENELQALMEAAPNSTPARHKRQVQVFKDAVQDCINTLEPRDKFVVQAYDHEGLSYQQLANRLGITKSPARRLHLRILQQRLRPIMEAHPDLSDRIAEAPTTWDEACRRKVFRLQMLANNTLQRPYEMSLQDMKDAYERRRPSELLGAMVTLGADAMSELGGDAAAREECIALIIDRHHKYGTGNIMVFEELGLMVRMGDKIARIANSSQDFADETYKDALMDLVGYATIALMLDDDSFMLPLEDES